MQNKHVILAKIITHQRRKEIDFTPLLSLMILLISLLQLLK